MWLRILLCFFATLNFSYSAYSVGYDCPALLSAKFARPDSRKQAVDSMRSTIESRSRDLVLRTDRPYDVIVIGGGVSAAVYTYNLMQQAPNARVLVLEKNPFLGSYFTRFANSLLLNSGVSAISGWNMNVFPNLPMQLSDFVEYENSDVKFPRAQDVSDLVYASFFLSQADILLNADVQSVQSNKVQVQGKKIKAKKIVIATGYDEPSFGGLAQGAARSKIEHFVHAMDYLNAHVRGATKYAGQRVAVIGAGDAGNNMVEQLLSLPVAVRNLRPGTKSKRVSQLIWIGQPSRTLFEYIHNNKGRYSYSGTPLILYPTPSVGIDEEARRYELTKEALKDLRKRLVLEPTHANKIRKSGRGFIVTADSGASYKVDRVILATGMRGDAMGLVANDNPSYDFDSLPKNMVPIVGSIDIMPALYPVNHKRLTLVQKPFTYSDARIALKLKGSPIYFIGNSVPSNWVVTDHEAKDGSAASTDEAQFIGRSGTYSKDSFQHNLPRAAALARRHAQDLLDKTSRY